MFYCISIKVKVKRDGEKTQNKERYDTVFDSRSS